jgi:hypothetical protein
VFSPSLSSDQQAICFKASAVDPKRSKLIDRIKIQEAWEESIAYFL